jgi:hypothetical protein
MADFNIRSDAIDVEQIMRQIRARIREKRGVDYTEDEIQQLAAIKLEKFLDPRGVRSDLLERFRKSRAVLPPPAPGYVFEDTTLFESDKGVVRLIRKLLRPILKLFFNPNTLIAVLHTQAELNARNAQLEAERAELDRLYFEVMHNLVLEMTRVGIEAKNMRMRVESIASRLDFNERRARALEGVVQYKPAEERQAAASPVRAADRAAGDGAGDSQRSRRRRRRRGRRGPGTLAPAGGPIAEATADQIPPPAPEMPAAEPPAPPSPPGDPSDQ